MSNTTRWAVSHLLLLGRQIRELRDTSDLNMMDAQSALEDARDRLVQEKPVYREAAEIILEAVIPYIREMRAEWEQSAFGSSLTEDECRDMDVGSLVPSAMWEEQIKPIDKLPTSQLEEAAQFLVRDLWNDLELLLGRDRIPSEEIAILSRMRGYIRALMTANNVVEQEPQE